MLTWDQLDGAGFIFDRKKLTGMACLTLKYRRVFIIRKSVCYISVFIINTFYLQNSGVCEALLDFLLQRAYFLYIFLTVHIFCVII